MFSDRCLGLRGCGHSTNWTCPCTCDEHLDDQPHRAAITKAPAMTDAQRIEGMSRYVSHERGCEANDLDPLDHTPCTCGLRAFFNPWNRKDTRQ